jgi:hypothetical protein
LDFDFQVSTTSQRDRSPPVRLELNFGADRNWNEAASTEATSDSFVIMNDMEDEVQGVDLDRAGDVSGISEESSMIESVPVMPECNWKSESCFCGRDDHTLYAVPRHKVVSRMEDCDRGMDGQLVVVAFNKARLFLNQRNTRFWKISDVGVVTVLDHALLSMMRVVVEVMSHASRLTIVAETKMEAVVEDRLEAQRYDCYDHDDPDSYDVPSGYTSYNKGRRLAAEANKTISMDMLFHLAATLYLLGFHLVKMAQSHPNECLRSVVIGRKDVLRQSFPAHPWHSADDDCCKPSNGNMVECIHKIWHDLLDHAEGEVSNILVHYEDVFEQLFWVGEIHGYESEEMALVRNLHEVVLSRCRMMFIDAAVRMEIGAQYFLKMAKGIFTVDPPIDLCGSMNQLFDDEWNYEECRKCGNMTQFE